MHVRAHVQALINTRVYIYMLSFIPAYPSRAGAGAGVGFTVAKPESLCPPSWALSVFLMEASPGFACKHYLFWKATSLFANKKLGHVVLDFPDLTLT